MSRVHQAYWGDIPEWTLLPAQTRTTPTTPEKRFVVAVIEQALRDADSSHGPLRDEARNWIFSRMGKLTFEEACELVGLEAQPIRKLVSSGRVGLTTRRPYRRA